HCRRTSPRRGSTRPRSSTTGPSSQSCAWAMFLSSGQLGEDPLAEGLQEGGLMLADVVQVDGVEAEVGETMDPLRHEAEVAGDQHAGAHLLLRDALAADLVERGPGQVPARGS